MEKKNPTLFLASVSNESRYQSLCQIDSISSVLFYYSSPAVSHYIYFYTLKFNSNPNYREVEVILCSHHGYIRFCQQWSRGIRILLVTYSVLSLTGYNNTRSGDMCWKSHFLWISKWARNALHHCFRLTARQTRDLRMAFRIFPTNDLLSPHYNHLSVSMLTLCTQGRPDGISNVPESRTLAI